MNISEFKFDQHKKTILIVDIFANGRAIVERLNKAGVGLINFEYETLNSLVEKRTNDYISSNVDNIFDINKLKLKVIKDSYCSFILRNIISSDPSLLPFVKQTSYSLATFSEILRVINIIRKVNVVDKANEKLSCLINLANIFEQSLKETSLDGSNGVYDSVRLLKEFKEYYVDNSEYYVVKEYYDRLLPLEKQVVDKFVKSPDRHIQIASDVEVKPNTFTSYGKFNEVQGVLDRITNHDLNDVTIYYSSSIYENYLRAALKNRHIPYKFQNEISAGDNQIYCLLQDIILWANNSYRFSLFKNICSNPLLNYKKKLKDGTNEDRFALKEFEELKKAHIDYSLENYKVFCDNLDNPEYINAINDLAHDPMVVSEYFIDFIKDLVDIFTNMKTNPGDLLFDLTKLINKYRDFEQDSNANKSVISFLYDYSKVLPLYGNVDNEKELFDVVIKAVGMLTVEEKDDMYFSKRDDEEKIDVLTSYVNVCKLSKSFVLGRKINYFIGMSFNEFMVDSFDSPVLSDEIINEHLDDGHNNKYILNKNNQILMDESFKLSLTTKDNDYEINLVSSTYDTVNFEESSPSNLFMQYSRRPDNAPKYDFVYNGITKNGAGHDFERFCNELILLHPEQGLIKDEIDINGNIINKAKFSPHLNIQHYRNGTKEIVKYVKSYLSPTRIQNAFKCPYSFVYALSNVYFEDESDGEKDLSTWLQANDLGTFYHSIFEEYANKYLIGKDSYESDHTLFESIFDKHAAIYLKVFGKQNQFEATREVLLENTINVLDETISDLDNSGFKVMANELNCTSKPLTIAVEDNKEVEFVLHGKLDRVDVLKDEDGETYRIIDYKSCSKASIEQKVKSNTYLQHLIYPYLLQAYLGKELKNNVKFSYVSIADNGVTVDFEVDTSNYESLLDIAKKLFDIGSTLDKEQKVYSSDEPCKYCKLNDICFLHLKGKKPEKKEKGKKDE